jgi:ATP adenylyltransferase
MDYLWTPWRYAYVTGADRRDREGIPKELEAWPGDEKCVFCNMRASVAYAVAHGMPAEDAERAAGIILRAEHCFVVLNAFPYTSGHVMVVPYRHESSLAALDRAAAHELVDLAQRTERVLNRVYTPQGVNLGINLGKAAGAGIAEHMHMHALPRWLGDTNFMTVVGEARILPEALDVTWQRLREGFAAEP